MTDFLDRLEQTGIRCDECSEMVVGPTGTPIETRIVTARAESLGWQCAFVNGKSEHRCPQHRRSMKP